MCLDLTSRQPHPTPRMGLISAHGVCVQPSPPRDGRPEGRAMPTWAVTKSLTKTTATSHCSQHTSELMRVRQQRNAPKKVP